MPQCDPHTYLAALCPVETPLWRVKRASGAQVRVSRHRCRFGAVSTRKARQNGDDRCESEQARAHKLRIG